MSGPMCSLCNGTGESGSLGGVGCRQCHGWGETHPDGEAFHPPFPGPDPSPRPDLWATAKFDWPGMAGVQFDDPPF